jgi:hypothetical protein
MDLARNAAKDLRVRATRIREERGNHSSTNGNTSTNNTIFGRSLGFGLEMTNQILGKKDLVCMLVVRCIDFLDFRVTQRECRFHVDIFPAHKESCKQLSEE